MSDGVGDTSTAWEEDWEVHRLELVAAIGDLVSEGTEITSETESWEVELVETAEGLRELYDDSRDQAAGLRRSLFNVTLFDEKVAAIQRGAEHDELNSFLRGLISEVVRHLMWFAS